LNTYFNLATYFYDISDCYGDKIALRYENKDLSYNQLNQLSNKIGNFLLSEGIKPHDVVGILNTKESYGYAAMLACLKIGAAYTNIDTESPINRVEKILNSCQPKILITDKDINLELQERVLNSKNIEYFKLDEDMLKNFDSNNLAISSRITGSTPAYIMFTSGSTGIPKGVAISHASVLSFIGWSIDRYKISSADRFAQVSPMYFDNSVFDFYTALFSGASLVPIKKEITTRLAELINLVDSMKCSIWFSVPSFLVYLQTMRVMTDDTFQSIRVFTFGGEGFPKGALKKLYDNYGRRAEIINVYGPTEGTCICSSYNIGEKDFNDMNSLAPLGTINPNFDYIIVDQNMQNVQIGEKGELCLIGPNVALGYYNDLDRTSENFVQNPNIKSHRDIIYKCGDVVFEKEGFLHFAGRVDNQIKHMGYRIELEEIESALNALSNVSQSAVLYDRMNTNYGQIVAFISSEIVISEAEIQLALELTLPKYMIPNRITVLQDLPKNANGKVDKNFLLNG
jgi:D-alanine--poly(phosphoribitol) ligase subunit 1